MKTKDILISDYIYDLPESRIASEPTSNRGDSKLLVYKNNTISDHLFGELGNLLPNQTLLIFNNTKVINARLIFKKESGGLIEIFCLQPENALKEYNIAMQQTKSVRWMCFVGGASKWKGIIQKEIIIDGHNVVLSALNIKKHADHYIVELSWDPPQFTFAEILEEAGKVPLPPYIKREVVEADKERYQTIYAHHNGSVAAPTAGLHFTEPLLEELDKRNIQKGFVTLHVGAGTFKPVKSKTIGEHDMHTEWITVDLETITQLMNGLGNVAAVGTTSARTIESLFWLGVMVLLHPETREMHISQWMVYEDTYVNTTITPLVALTGLLNWLHENKMRQLIASTQLLIAPGYQFRIVKMLITNFHQPASTLLLMIAAAVGADWKNIYDHALSNDYRFLSFGDSNLLFLLNEN